MKHVQACLNTMEDSFHRCGGPVRLVQSCLGAGNTLITPFKPPRWRCEARGGLFMWQGRPRKQFSSLWMYCEARASLCIFGKELITPFYPPRRCGEAHASMFKCLRRSRKPFHNCESNMGFVQAC